MGKGIILGRFQPFHNGHAYLIEQALARFEKVTIAVGSAQEEWTVDNPFSFEERKNMIQQWIDANGHTENVNIVGIEDINDPPNWVEHASNHHGKGTLVTSDVGTRTLYEESDFAVSWVDLHERQQFEGWRIRQTCMMLSTVYDDEATRMVLAPSVPSPVIEWLIEQDGLYRFSQINTSPHAG
ncbi:MAG: Bifunctional NMN adenylyltransferase/Nudix hydrolase [Candidatus Poseidoniaceae archaeon]|nr:MAG: Bifunctional NMN adenylyltransferase/Nudix hydrolase [Candidatus Poseidoniaceae archaeon]